jgi:cytidine deaminase
MKEEQITFSYTVFDDSSQLNDADGLLVEKARQQTAIAYAPYSKFQVSAVAQLNNGEILVGTNQENASYPITTCAERVLLGTIANTFPEMPIASMAISYNSQLVSTAQPISPCGMCRQALSEYEIRTQQPIRLLLTGQSGQVWLIEKASSLLPLAFTAKALETNT